MRLYEGTTQQFIEDAFQNRLPTKLSQAFELYYGRRTSPGEISSWTNSLQFVKNLLERNTLLNDYIVVEYELPYSTRRIDVMLFGNSTTQQNNVVVMELKQWSEVDDSEIEGNIMTAIGGGKGLHVHPSIQVREYHNYLRDFVGAFEGEQPLNLSSCVYCHNYSRTGPAVLLSSKFQEVLKDFPLFTNEDFESLGTYLKSRLSGGAGLEIFNRFATSEIRPSKKLLEHTNQMIKGHKAFYLIDEQMTAYNTILDRAKKSAKLKKKTVIIVRGGPGTGKSVIALNVIAELLSKNLIVFHATGSKAFTSTLRQIVGTRAAKLFRYFNSFMHTTTKENELDVLVCDEAHRIRKTSNSRFTSASARSELPQIDELMRAAKLLIFFIDDYQIVRPDEIGSSQLISETAKKFDADIYDFELKTQFRCSGSDGYLNWVDNTLGIRETANMFLTKNEKMDFRIFDSPQALYEEIKKKNAEKPNSARMVAGFCWSWSDPNPDGTLKDDVVIGDFKMTWEAKNEAKNLAPGIPRAALWAHDPNGVSQMGSIYTIQGFEFDYVGVVFGKDVVYDPVSKTWVGKPEHSADGTVKRAKTDFMKYARNAYRVLLTRGMKGCYVYFMDENTRKYFESRLSQ
jgi:DUF2075 family protein